jgi:hypothetical protein
MLQANVWNRPRSWLALLAIGVAAGAVLWQILACIESPMSFSPSGELVFSVMEPYARDGDGEWLAGRKTFRVLVLGKDRKLRELERSTTHMLSGAAFSPDGERLAYLRIALPTAQSLGLAKAFVERLGSTDEKIRAEAKKQRWVFAAPPAAPQRPPKGLPEAARDLGLPPMSQMAGDLPQAGAVLPAELVVRNAATGAIVSAWPIDLPIGDPDKPSLSTGYLLNRAQWLAGGDGIAFYVEGLPPLTVSLRDGEPRLLSGPWPGPVSPDGRVVANMAEETTLRLARVDGMRSVYARVNHKVKDAYPERLAWIGPDRVAILSNEKPGEFVVEVIDREGRPVRSHTLALGGEKSEDDIEIAVSPDAKRMVIGRPTRVHFLSIDGKPLGEWRAQANERLVRPTFAPDSKQVAFRDVDLKDGSTKAIVFFDPQGRGLMRIAVPPAAIDLPPLAASAPAAAR